MKNDLTTFASEMGKKGGKKSAEIRFKNKTKQEISRIMSQVRASKSSIKLSKRIGEENIESLRSLGRP